MDEGRFEAARASFESAQLSQPDSFWPAFWMAMILARSGRNGEAIDVYRQIVAKHPDDSYGYVGLASTLITAKDYDQADATLVEGIARCGFEYWLGFNLALSADSGFDHPLASERWEKVVAHYPQEGYALGRWARALINIGELDKAERLLLDAGQALAGHTQVLFSRAMLASARGHDEESAVQWRRLRAANPGDMEIEGAWGLSEQALLFAEGETPSPLQPAANETLNQFTSLGGDCEFGLVQRHYGLEPLGLLRWSSSSPANLSRLLDDGLERIGDPAHTSLTADNDQDVYYLTLTAYDLMINTMVKIRTVDADKFLSQQNRRTSFLLRQLLGQFDDGDKIFVYKTNEPLDQAVAQRLCQSVARYGDVRLLYVAAAGLGEESGGLEVVGKNLIIARLAGIGPLERSWNIPYGAWLDLCERVERAFSKLRAAAHDPVIAS